MKQKLLLAVTLCFIACVIFSFRISQQENAYTTYYEQRISGLRDSLTALLARVQHADWNNPESKKHLQAQIQAARNELKQADFWLRYLEPLAYKSAVQKQVWHQSTRPEKA